MDRFQPYSLPLYDGKEAGIWFYLNLWWKKRCLDIFLENIKIVIHIVSAGDAKGALKYGGVDILTAIRSQWDMVYPFEEEEKS